MDREDDGRTPSTGATRELAPEHALARYPDPWRSGRYEPAASPGRSGGAVWRVRGRAGDGALRCYPANYPRERVPSIHRLMQIARDAGVFEVPVPIADRSGATLVEWGGRTWELTDWRPGRPADAAGADQLHAALRLLARFHRAITPGKLGDAARALGSERTLHAWRSGSRGESPALLRRRSEWRRLRSLGPSVPRGHPLEALAQRTRWLARRLEPAMDAWLAPPIEGPIAVCLRDVHRAHILFDGSATSGLLDFGAAALDVPVVDLARWLGDACPGDAAHWAAPIESYLQTAPLPEDCLEACLRLDRTGTMIGALHWLEWLVLDPAAADPAHGAARWGELLDRIESWPEIHLPSPRTRG